MADTLSVRMPLWSNAKRTWIMMWLHCYELNCETWTTFVGLQQSNAHSQKPRYILMSSWPQQWCLGLSWWLVLRRAKTQDAEILWCDLANHIGEKTRGFLYWNTVQALLNLYPCSRVQLVQFHLRKESWYLFHEIAMQCHCFNASGSVLVWMLLRKEVW